MATEPPTIEQSDLMLAEAAKLDLVLMRHVHGLALDTVEPQPLATFVGAYAKVSRCMRQNLALLARQKAERAKAQREADRHEVGLRAHGPDPHDLAIETRVVELQHAVDRVICAASDGDTARHTDWAHRFDRESDDWIERPDFLLEDFDTQVLRACRTLGLPDHLAQRWQDLPDPTFVPDPEPETPEEIAAANAFCRETLARFKAASGGSPTDPAKPPVPWKNSG